MNQNSEGIIFYELRNFKGNIVARHGQLDLLPDIFSKNNRENFSQKGLKNAFRENANGSIQLIVDENADLFQGSKAIQRACSIYLSLIPKFKEIEVGQRQSFDAIIRRFSHNLIKFQNRFKNNFVRLISDKARARPYAEFTREVKRRIEENTSAAADDVCQMSHRAIDLDAQIETLRIIGGYADNTGTLLPTNIERALYRLTNPFIDELKKKNVDIRINLQNSDRNKINIVHSLFNAAIWQILDNACKYVLNDTTIDISGDLALKQKKISISMDSVSIEKDEEEIIFLENRQGRNIKNGIKSEISKNGSGIGLYIVRKALSYMKAKISVVNTGFIKNDSGYPYSHHVFEVEFLG
ncbi:MAG: ATP-binding protein [Patescibacteria group bacterium]